MARGLNKACLLGHLGADPEVRYTPAGTPVANMRIATTEQWNDRETGNRQERTEWHRLVAFGKLAEIVRDHVGKGDRIYVEGKLQTRKWQDQGGNDRYTTEVIVNEMLMLGGQQRQQGREPEQQQAGPSTQPAGPPDDFDDDIPF